MLNCLVLFQIYVFISKFVLGLGHTFSIEQIPVNDVSEYDEIGSVLYSKGNKLIIGAPLSQNLLGRVMVYERQSHDEDFKMTGQYYGRSSAEHFGGALTMLDNNLFVGSPYRTCYNDNKPFYRCGGVHVFDRTNGRNMSVADWATHTIESDIANSYNLFGYAIAVAGNVLAVGAPGYNGYLGHVSLYKRNALNQWVRQYGLSPSHNVFYGKFGHSIAMTERMIAVGAPGDNVEEYDGAGSVHVFVADVTETKWNLLKYLTSSVPTEYGAFGCSLAMYDNVVAVGADHAPGHSDNTGAVYLFEFLQDNENANQEIQGNYNLMDTLFAHDGESGDQFGCSVAMNGLTIAVGACGERGKKIATTGVAWQVSDGENCGVYSTNCVKYPGEYTTQGESAGALYLYSFDPVENTALSKWTEIRKVLPEVSGDHYYFGHSVAVNGDTVLVSATGADGSDGTQQVGAVYEVKVDWLYYRNGIASLTNVIIGVVVIAAILGVPASIYVVYLIKDANCYDDVSHGSMACGCFSSNNKGSSFGVSKVATVDSHSEMSTSLRSHHGLLDGGETSSVTSEPVSVTKQSFNIDSAFIRNSSVGDILLADKKVSGEPSVDVKKTVSEWGMSKPTRKNPLSPVVSPILSPVAK